MESGRLVFLTESMERMAEILGRSPILDGDDGHLADLHHCLRSVRGACGFLGMPTVVKMAQKGVPVVAALRDRTVVFNRNAQNALLKLVEVVREMGVLG